MKASCCSETEILSFKLNINPFEELAFAGSSFSMPKKDLSHILLAENIENQSSDEKDIVKDIVYNIMTNIYNLEVPLDVHIEIGNNWYEAK